MIQHAILGGSKWCQYLTWPENTTSSKIVDLLPMSIRAWKEGNICLCVYIYMRLFIYSLSFIYFPSGNQTYLAGKSLFSYSISILINSSWNRLSSEEHQSDVSLEAWPALGITQFRRAPRYADVSAPIKSPLKPPAKPHELLKPGFEWFRS